MAKPGIQNLIDSAGYRRGVALSQQLPAKTVKAIAADLREVIKAETEGRTIPSQNAIARYIAETYSVAVSRFMVHTWLSKLRQGKSIN